MLILTVFLNSLASRMIVNRISVNLYPTLYVSLIQIDLKPTIYQYKELTDEFVRVVTQ